jgi:RHS repeat-associated protein
MGAEGLPVDMATVFNETNDILEIGYLVPERTEIYSYDDKGNRLQETVRQINEKQTDYDYYDFSDRLRIRGDIAYEYDNVGNLIRKGSSFVFENNAPIFDETGEVYVEYEYDLFNRLVAVKKYNSDTASIETRVRYTYDAQNLRIERNHVEDGIERFFYDLSGVLIERYSGVTTRTEILLFGQHFARIEDDSTESITLFYHLDHLGSTTALSDINGEVIWSDEFTPFGLSSGESGERTEAGLYTGKDLDEETGFYYFNARWYSAELGRFITEDPIRDGVNCYAYVSGNPMMFVDPSGLYDKNKDGLLNSGWIGLTTTDDENALNIAVNFPEQNWSGHRVKVVPDQKVLDGVAVLLGFSSFQEWYDYDQAQRSEASEFFIMVVGGTVFGSAWDIGEASYYVYEGQYDEAAATVVFILTPEIVDKLLISGGEGVIRSLSKEAADSFEITAFLKSADNGDGFIQVIDGQAVTGQLNLMDGGVVFAGGEGERLLLPTLRDSLLNSVSDSKLKNLINQMYRKNATVGSGSTADVIRYELQTGELLSPKGHFLKGQEMRTAIMRLLQNGGLNEADAGTTRYILQDLQNALSGQ